MSKDRTRDESIKIRISKENKARAIEHSKSKGMSLSECIRELLYKDMEVAQ